MHRLDTYFAARHRAPHDIIQDEVELVSHHPVVDQLMRLVDGLFAVLNEHRQILALNSAMLRCTGFEDAGKVFGLRPGEAIGCAHANLMPGGCGTSELCQTCGAAIAIVTALGKHRPSERSCAVTVERKGRRHDLYFRVHACPVTFHQQGFVLLLMQDISEQQRLMAMEQIFFHDINNSLMGLLNASELLCTTADADSSEEAILARNIWQFANRINQQVAMQRHLTDREMNELRQLRQQVSLAMIIEDVNDMVTSHPAARHKHLIIAKPTDDVSLMIDFSMCMRVLHNMIINAFEATDEDGQVRLSIIEKSGHIEFSVWNAGIIPTAVAKRVFQRNFSTKSDIGRGLGTYSMKIFGEHYLEGKVWFDSTLSNGTTFYFRLPLRRAIQKPHTMPLGGHHRQD